jgi:hypothetical protein
MSSPSNKLSESKDDYTPTATSAETAVALLCPKSNLTPVNRSETSQSRLETIASLAAFGIFAEAGYPFRSIDPSGP